MPSGRQALSALLAGAIGAGAILALALATSGPAREAGAALPRFAVVVSPASASLLEDPAVRSRLDLRPLPSTDGLIGEMGRLDADGVILDRTAVVQMSTAGLASLLRSGRVVVAIGVDAQEMQHLAGLNPDFTPHQWPRPHFSIVLITDRYSRGTSMDYSMRTFVGLIEERTAAARAERTPTPAPTPATK